MNRVVPRERLYERYRPQYLRQIIGQDKAVGLLTNALRAGLLSGEALWLDGETGVGKTTAGLCLARMLGCGPWSVEVIEGSRCTAPLVHELGENMGLLPLDSQEGWRVYIVNNADSMTQGAAEAFLDLLEVLPARRLFVFTSRRAVDGLFPELGNQLRGRCMRVHFTNQGLADKFARLLYHIAQREGLNGKPFEDYRRLLKDCNNSPREGLQRIQLGEMKGA